MQVQTIEADPAFAHDVLSGLRAVPKSIPCRWLYDDRGSQLFQQITDLPEYYPTRTETAILHTHAAEIAARIEPGSILVEYGAGASVKTRILLDALPTLAAYVPVDISGNFLTQAAQKLAADYPNLPIAPIVGDFMQPLDLAARRDLAGAKLGFFPGSTIGNLSNADIRTFLSAARESLGAGGRLLLGADLAKSTDVLLPAYDDAQGVTAKFNLNLLTRINRELAGSFDLAQFAHQARWNPALSRVEMHLVSLTDQQPTVLGEAITLQKEESIHTENSRKFDMEALSMLAQEAGWTLSRSWFDERKWFCLALLVLR